MITQEQHDEIVAELNQRLIEHRQGMKKRITELHTALRVLFSSYKQLADSGDAGHWRLEDTDAGKTAMAALGIKDDGAPKKPIIRFWDKIFEAYGMEWYQHIPGHLIPCPDNKRVTVLLRGHEPDNVYNEAATFMWKKFTEPFKDCEIIGWRPADAPTKLPKEVPQC